MNDKARFTDEDKNQHMGAGVSEGGTGDIDIQSLNTRPRDAVGTEGWTTCQPGAAGI